MNVFTTAWKDLKKAGSQIASFVVKDQTEIAAAVAAGSEAVVAVSPALAPEVTVFDSVEESVMGELLKISSTDSGAAALATLSTTLASTITSVKGLVSGHPAVVAASTPTPAA